MTDERRIDDIIQAWITSGPDAAPPDLAERTLRPIPRMRQRRSWRITLDRLTRPVGALVATAAVMVVAVTAIGVLGGRSDHGQGAGPSANGGVRAPSFVLVLGEGGAATRYASDPAAGLAICDGDGEGPWTALYGGGDPFVSIDLLVGAGAARPEGADRVAAEIDTGDHYVRFDPAILRGGDAAGRSSASVAVLAEGDATTFVITATTPERQSGTDGAPIALSLTLTCAPRP